MAKKSFSAVAENLLDENNMSEQNSSPVIKSNTLVKSNSDSNSLPRMVDRERKTRHFNALLKPSIHDQFREAAQNTGVSINDAVEIAMRLFIRRYGKRENRQHSE